RGFLRFHAKREIEMPLGHFKAKNAKSKTLCVFDYGTPWCRTTRGFLRFHAKREIEMPLGHFKAKNAKSKTLCVFDYGTP
ncbi:MAG: hypothetical protein K2N38_11435, partial [Oscillospiraceae bacterium]|nr:hypothetical protein [Oscillospiraceae bacterium]